jgi:predicted nucleic-acid-binding protein
LIAIDTNVLLRLILDDEPEQAKAARGLLAENVLYVPLTVTLETEWVLRAAYRLQRNRIADAIEFAVEMENLKFENSNALYWITARYRDGADFADLVHIISSKEAKTFATFDKKIEKQAALGCPLVVKTI